MSELDIDIEVISRWEPTGLIDGLPIWDKEDLSRIYDNTVRIILSDKVISKLPKDVSELLEECAMLVIRRLYRRVGINFDLEEMLGKLLEDIVNSKNSLTQVVTPELNPVVEFIVDFSDNYEDESTSKTMLTNEEYTEKVDKLLKHVREVLLNNNLVTNVDKSGDDWTVKLSDKKKSPQSTRFWNQKIGKELFNYSLSDINKE